MKSRISLKVVDTTTGEQKEKLFTVEGSTTNLVVVAHAKKYVIASKHTKTCLFRKPQTKKKALALMEKMEQDFYPLVKKKNLTRKDLNKLKSVFDA